MQTTHDGKLESDPTGGHCRRQDISVATLFEDFVGGSPEIDAKIQTVQCTALLDTSSQITTVSKSFYQNKLSHTSLQNCQNLLWIEGVGGGVLLYLGFIVCLSFVLFNNAWSQKGHSASYTTVILA